MKILFINTNIGYGGASKMMAWVASQYAEAGHSVTFLTYRDDGCCQLLNPKVLHVHEPLEDVSGKEKNVISCVRYIHNFIEKERFEVAIAFLSPSHLRLSLASIGTGCRTLFSERGDPSQKARTIKGIIAERLSRMMFCSADFFVFQTPMAAKYYPQKVQDRSLVISNPIKPLIRTKERVVGGDKTIVCIARLDIQQKRQDLLIDAFKLISARFPEYSLRLYGDGDSADERTIREKVMDNPQIHLMGPTKDVVAALQCATMSVLPSDFEGIPNVLLESMSLGVPTVATDCSPGGAAMLIRSYENGIIVPRNDATALASAMEFVITHPDAAETMGMNGMEVNTIYAENVIAKKWLSIIDREKNENNRNHNYSQNQ